MLTRQVELLALSQQLDDAKISSRANLDMAPEVQSAISGATYVAQHLKQEDAFNRVSDIYMFIDTRPNSELTFRPQYARLWRSGLTTHVHVLEILVAVGSRI